MAHLDGRRLTPSTATGAAGRPLGAMTAPPAAGAPPAAAKPWCHAPARGAAPNAMQDMLSLAQAFVATAKADALDDVERLGPEGAADYWADLARSQDYWDRLDTPQGRAALRKVADEMAWSAS